jgi:hypothetical protein
MFGGNGWLHEVSDEVAFGSQWKADQHAKAAELSDQLAIFSEL